MLGALKLVTDVLSCRVWFCSEKACELKGTTSKLSAMTRKLSFTKGEGSKPKSGLGQTKKVGSSPMSKTIKKRSPGTKLKGGVAIGRTSMFRNNNGLTVPKHFKCAFKTSTDMRLDHIEVKVVAYVFQDDYDASDVIFKVGGNEYARSDFECMCPGMLVTGEIILMTALRVAWTQQNALSKTVWCLPPSFADDVTKGNTVENLHKFYGKDWMGRFDRLSLIFVPIEDNRCHWYLMVISIDNHKIYHLDSHLREDVVEERQCNIRNISLSLAKLVEIVYDGFTTFCPLVDFHNWDIVEARGVPNCGNSDNSALWVAKWLNMQNSFTNNIIGVMEEGLTRMMVTLRILMGNHNQCNDDLIRKAKEYWQFMTTNDDHV